VTVPGLTAVTGAYNSLGGLSQVRQGSRLWQYDYDASGRLSTVTDPLLRQVTYEYDASDRLTRQTLPGGRQVLYGYDATGNLTTITPPSRPQHRFDHTVVDLDSVYTPPALPGIPDPTTRYAYDRDRRLTGVLRPDGVAVSLHYDGAGRLASLSQPRGATLFTYFLTSGQLATLTSPDGVTCTHSYDGSLPLREQWSGAVTGEVVNGFDSDFRVATQTVTGTPAVTFAYDNDGLLSRAGAMTITRNAGNGLVTGTTLAGITTSKTYTAFGELASLSATGPAGPLYNSSYDHDAVGRTTKWTLTVAGTSRVREYGYDAASRLQTVRDGGVLVEQYGYDANGNRVSFTGTTAGDTATGTYDDQDRLLRYKDTTFGYTPNGDLALKATGADTTRYTYDGLGNLILVVLPDGTRIEYVIDGQNRRVGRKRNGTLVATWLYQNGLDPVAELDASGNVTARYVYGSSGHAPDYVIKGDSTYQLIRDHLGSIRLVVSVTSGLVAEERDYDAWGRTTLDTAPGFITLGYESGIADLETGLIRFGARDYDPTVGRWTGKDPMGGTSDDWQLYGYVGASPIDFYDEWGLFKLPNDPRNLPPGWKPDQSGEHKDPNGQRFFNPLEPDRYLDFSKARPGEPGWKGRDHWHDSSIKKKHHLLPGDEVRDPIPQCPPHPPVIEPVPWWFKIPWEIPLPIIIIPPGGFPDPDELFPPPGGTKQPSRRA